MATINDYFEQAQLSQAAYALNLQAGMFGGSDPNSPYILALKKGGMSEAQAIAFANEYTTVDQYSDDVSGFSGTVFKDKAGNYHMAIRGSELTATDWSENFANIGSDGVAIEQGVSLYNWYQRLTSPAGSTVSQVAYHKEETDLLGNITTPAWLESYTVSLGQNEGGELLNATSITVSGHSIPSPDFFNVVTPGGEGGSCVGYTLQRQVV